LTTFGNVSLSQKLMTRASWQLTTPIEAGFEYLTAFLREERLGVMHELFPLVSDAIADAGYVAGVRRGRRISPTAPDEID
jgi:hypothetical protein